VLAVIMPHQGLIALVLINSQCWLCGHVLQDEFEGEIPPYPYMRMRTRETFPWGSDLGLFEKHQHVHPLQ
jgi:hypothetical protein